MSRSRECTAQQRFDEQRGGLPAAEADLWFVCRSSGAMWALLVLQKSSSPNRGT
ncbi:MAG: hypothetical protein O3B90_02020 [Actinomycetota bacterium]|nr:hypothetical protein [Actinomycetota bacterium]